MTNPQSTALVPLEATPAIGSGATAVPALDVNKVFGDLSVFNDLPQEYRAQALELSSRINITHEGADLTALREEGKKSRDVLNSLGSLLIDDASVNEADYVGDLLREVRDAKKEINLDLIAKDPNAFREFLMSLPVIGSWFNPVFQFQEGFQSVDGKIDGWNKRLNEAEVDSVQQEEMLKDARNGNMTAYRALDVAVGGTEHALYREFQEFQTAVIENVETADDITLLELGQWRTELENAMLALVRYQNARARSIANFPILSQMIARTHAVIVDIVSLRDTVIPQIRIMVGASIQNLKTRQRMQTNRELTDLQRDVEQQLIEALKRAGQEEHALRMSAAGDGERIALLFEGLSAIAEEAVKNRATELAAFAESKKTILAAIEGWQEHTRDVLESSVREGVAVEKKTDDGEGASA